MPEPTTAAGQFYEDHERDMADPEYAEGFREATAEVTTTAADRLVAVVKITGGSLREIARRLEDAAYDLEVKARAGCTSAEIISGHGIITVRNEESAPVVDWREREIAGITPEVARSVRRD